MLEYLLTLLSLLALNRAPLVLHAAIDLDTDVSWEGCDFLTMLLRVPVSDMRPFQQRHFHCHWHLFVVGRRREQARRPAPSKSELAWQQ